MSGDETSDEPENSDQLPPTKWPMYGVDPQNTGHHPTATGPSGEDVKIQTVFKADDAIHNNLIIDNDQLYATSADGSFLSINIAENKSEWEKNINTSSNGYPLIIDERIYTGIDQGLAAVNRKNGELRWKQDSLLWEVAPIPTNVGVIGTQNRILHQFDPETGNDDTIYNTRQKSASLPISTVPALNNGAAYFAAEDTLFSVNIEDRELEWTFKNPRGELMGEVNPTVDNNTVYITGEDERLYAIDVKDGSKKWSIDTLENPGSPSLANSVVYLMASGSVLTGGDVWLLAIDVDEQKIIWKKNLESRLKEKPVISNGSVYHSNRNNIYAFDAKNGELQ
ncbi:PQQ-like beta-propeller repeat protein [Natrinema zhouii]|uniref:PQQ-binding-like beta-propeller repeat protein n=1 Tax=Natrinema zhouii TaxID=1710539 RepID=A0A7D6CSU8_9EURY|nr:PQQ-binding-like beta-propeller repeat protein [Natrinema zhouii]QLK27250.1 PQQ-like beta-propeller repeat protein [Natrinema zhouii]